jgi:hypothetical protein
MIDIIILILDDDSNPVYDLNRQIWKKLMNKFRNKTDMYFIRCSNVYTETTLCNDTIYVNGTESYIPGILHKTVESFKYCISNLKVDFFFRTNISTMINYHKLCEYIKSLNNINCVSAMIGHSPENIKFPSGCGYIISKNIINKIIDSNTLDYTLIDDVSLGKSLEILNIPIIPAPRFDFYVLERYNLITMFTICEQNNIFDKHFHFRVKMLNDRHREHIIMDKLNYVLNDC